MVIPGDTEFNAVDKDVVLGLLSMKWNQILRRDSCGGPYDKIPCRAKTCKPADVWCGEHAELQDID
jgi:hypothetical protein